VIESRPMDTSFKGAFISVLKQAQILDKEIYDLNSAVEDAPGEIRTLEETFSKQKVHLDQLTQDLRTLQLKHKEFDNDLKTREASITKIDGQLSQVKTNKEYAALQQEIKSIKADISMVEEKILMLFDEIDAQQGKVNVEKERLKKDETEVSKRKKEIEDNKAQALERIKTLNTQRKDILKKIDSEIVAQYERIVKYKQGIALSPLQDENCGVCQMTIRPQIQNEVKLGDKMVLCEACGRILYVETH